MAVNFRDEESSFYQFMISNGYQNTRTKTNYLSWLRFLSDNYSIDDSITNEKIEIIIEKEKIMRNFRDKYKREKDISDFRSALRKYLLFINSDFEKTNIELIEKKIETIKTDKKLTITEKKTIILSRIGQGLYRKNLINYWNSCSTEHYTKYNLLIASHIKPWKNSNNNERIDHFNGLLLPPNYDKLFDNGYITFDIKGRIKFSKFITDEDKSFFGLKNDIQLKKIDFNHLIYLEYHNDNILIK